jgi:hypothetical protein
MRLCAPQPLIYAIIMIAKIVAIGTHRIFLEIISTVMKTTQRNGPAGSGQTIVLHFSK